MRNRDSVFGFAGGRDPVFEDLDALICGHPSIWPTYATGRQVHARHGSLKRARLEAHAAVMRQRNARYIEMRERALAQPRTADRRRFAGTGAVQA